MRLKSSEAREFRWHTIVALSQQEKTQSQISALLTISQSSVSRVLSKVKEGKPPHAGKAPGAKSKLDAGQRLQLEQLLTTGALAYGFENEYWTDKRVVRVIQESFGVSYSDRQVNKIIKNLVFSKQRFFRQDNKQSPQLVQAWKEQDLPAIKKKAQAEKRLIGYQDETAICLCPPVKATYAKK